MADNSFDRISQRLAGTSSRRQALKLIGGGLVGGVAAAKGLSLATAQTGPGQIGVPIVTDAFEGIFNITEFAVRGGQVNAIGTLTGAGVLDDVEIPVDELLSLPVLDDTNGDCQVLNLVLGPLYLNVLGLVIEIPDPIVVNIFAVQGGGLLGDLLCAVSNLLSGNGRALGRLSNLLNQILGAITGGA